ncbi:hypothetical protein P4V88_26865 [Bacillus thuringiensis]|uniref:hypothetical protein n=1 Tax=Bacillus cereus group TaxID=86661 RepID=UPI001E2CA342|nr:hypothetical protein [Bacillus thuringiensis]MEB9541596.1 hypothetical protein [Bacillus cereus]MED2125012.1 hypothetical protein [Bacillus thuringiensis]MED2149903.1 hypothetical protein [Bacillus thuringiensis]MED2175522.1 hypothetical protein [Bacillus thuringiensis]MED2477846.1 hypothetical protein [Bacillus thuringiensis]
MTSLINPLSGLIQRKVEDINIEIEASLAWLKDNKSEILEKFLELYFEFNNNGDEFIKKAIFKCN